MCKAAREDWRRGRKVGVMAGLVEDVMNVRQAEASDNISCKQLTMVVVIRNYVCL